MLQTLPVADHTHLEGDHASMLSVSFLSPAHLRPDGDASLLVGGWGQTPLVACLPF